MYSRGCITAHDCRSLSDVAQKVTSTKFELFLLVSVLCRSSHTLAALAILIHGMRAVLADMEPLDSSFSTRLQCSIRLVLECFKKLTMLTS